MTEPKDIRKREALIKIHSTQKVGENREKRADQSGMDRCIYS